MKISLLLYKDNVFTHTQGIWGETLWGHAMAKGLRELGHEAEVYGINMGYFPKETDLAIYFHSILPSFEKPIGKNNVAIFHNWNADISLDTRLLPYAKFKGKVATISMVLSKRMNWKFLYPCVDSEMFYAVKKDPSFAYDLLYIGNNIKEPELNKRFLTQHKNIKYGFFGNGFPTGALKNKSYELKMQVSSLACLNFGMKECVTLEGLIARPFQTALCKGYVISDKNPVLMEIFGDNMYYAEDSTDIAKHIEWLRANKEEREKKVEACYKIVKEQYNPKVQMQEFMEWAEI